MLLNHSHFKLSSPLIISNSLIIYDIINKVFAYYYADNCYRLFRDFAINKNNGVLLN